MTVVDEAFDPGLDDVEPLSESEGRDRVRAGQVQSRAEWFRVDREARRIVDAEEEAKRLADAPEPIPVMTIDEADTYYRSVAGKDLIEGVLPVCGIGQVFGPSGSGKTLVIINRSLSLAAGVPFMGRAVAEPVATLIVGFEGEHELHLRAMGAAHRMELPRKGIYFLPSPSLSTAEDSVERFISGPLAEAVVKADADGLRLGVVVFDTIRGLINASVNDDDATLGVTRLLKAVSRAIGGVAEVTTHSPHSDPSRAIGSVEQKASRDYEWRVSDGVVELTKSKSRPDGVVVGYFTVVSVPLPGRDTDVGVAEPVSAVAAAALAKTSTRAARASAREELTAREILRLCRNEATNPSGKALDGWSNNMIVLAMKGLHSRPVDPLDVHCHEKYLTKVLADLERGGLLEDRAKSRETGHARAWVTTSNGENHLLTTDAP